MCLSTRTCIIFVPHYFLLCASLCVCLFVLFPNIMTFVLGAYYGIKFHLNSHFFASFWGDLSSNFHWWHWMYICTYRQPNSADLCSLSNHIQLVHSCFIGDSMFYHVALDQWCGVWTLHIAGGICISYLSVQGECNALGGCIFWSIIQFLVLLYILFLLASIQEYTSNTMESVALCGESKSI